VIKYIYGGKREREKLYTTHRGRLIRIYPYIRCGIHMEACMCTVLCSLSGVVKAASGSRTEEVHLST
jgi:hypothetical protein